MSRNRRYFIKVDPNKTPQNGVEIVNDVDRDWTFRPTQAQRDQVEKFSGFGMKHKEICQLVINPATGYPIALKTLERWFKAELQRGGPMMKATLAGHIFGTAYGHEAEHDDKGKVTRKEAAPSARLLEYLGQVKLGWKKEVVLSNGETLDGKTVTIGEELKEMFAEAIEQNRAIMGNITIIDAVKNPDEPEPADR